jgi:hypothetical protein
VAAESQAMGGAPSPMNLACSSSLTILRAAAPGQALLAVTANALGAFVVCLYIPTLMTAVYNQAKRSACTLRFHVATEGAWDVGGASGCLVAALLVLAGVSLSVAILLSLSGAGGLFVPALLRGSPGGDGRRARAARPKPIVNSARQWQLTQVELEEPFMTAFQAAPSTLGVEHPPLATRFTTYPGLACNARARHSRRSRAGLCAGRPLR